MLLDQVIRTITRHAMFTTGQKAGLAVSGGADSVCLLHIMHRLASRWNLHLSVVHVDHGIRGAASAEDAEFVHNLATQFALPFFLRRTSVTGTRDNLEQAARSARQNFFLELIGGGKVDRIATGHTRSDQAETVLYRLLRGSGSAGLSGIRPVTREGIVRPLLASTREEVRDWLREEKIHWRDDETNQDCSYARNRIRHELLPQLRREYNPNVDDTLANMAEFSRDEEEYWTKYGHFVKKEGALCHLRTDSLTGERAIARRLIRQAIEAVKGDLRRIDFRHVERILNLAESERGEGGAKIPGVDVSRSFEWIRLAPSAFGKHQPDFVLAVDLPGTVRVPGTNTEISFQLIEREGTSASTKPCDSLLDELDWRKIVEANGPGALQLRNWRPGDHFQRTGHRNQKRIKLLFQEARIPSWDRHSWPILTMNGQIVWCRNFGAAAGLSADDSSKTILQIRDSNRKGT